MTAAAGSEISNDHEEIMIDFACIMKLILHHIRGKNVCLSKEWKSFCRARAANGAKLRAAGGVRLMEHLLCTVAGPQRTAQKNNLYLIVWL